MYAKILALCNHYNVVNLNTSLFRHLIEFTLSDFVQYFDVSQFVNYNIIKLFNQNNVHKTSHHKNI